MNKILGRGGFFWKNYDFMILFFDMLVILVVSIMLLFIYNLDFCYSMVSLGLVCVCLFSVFNFTLDV